MSASASSSAAAPPQNTRTGMDALLSQRGKSIAAGEEIRFVLVKGKSGIVRSDPVETKLPSQTFPLLAKFPETTVKPNFQPGGNFYHSRLYQQNAPTIEDDSDDEDAATNQEAQKKRRWKRRPQAPKRIWYLQQDTDFLETMVALRQHQPPPSSSSKQVSTKYIGEPEHNPSHYAVLSTDFATSASNNTNANNTVSVTTFAPPYATTTFTQPFAQETMSLTQAEQALSDKNAHLTRFMMHSKAKSGKSRLMEKLSASNQQQEEDDNVMADVAYRNRSRGSSKARKELLSEMVEDGVMVDDNGVLGGQHDDVFGGRRHFASLKKESLNAAASAKKQSTANNDGMAMSDDFYQRDVLAEYQDLDYDANEQFEDDDVDMGEKEVHLNPDTGLMESDTDEEDEAMPDDEDDSGQGAQGLASVAGFQKLLAKSRGETADPLEEAASDTEKKASSRPSSPKTAKERSMANDPLAKLVKAEQTQQQEQQNETDSPSAREPPTKKQKLSGMELDAQGRRVISLPALQREIWLNHGSIPTKRLTKIFGIKAKDKETERYRDFVEIAKKIATFEKDDLGNPILVLKQHYKKMG